MRESWIPEAHGLTGKLGLSSGAELSVKARAGLLKVHELRRRFPRSHLVPTDSMNKLLLLLLWTLHKPQGWMVAPFCASHLPLTLLYHKWSQVTPVP